MTELKHPTARLAKALRAATYSAIAAGLLGLGGSAIGANEAAAYNSTAPAAGSAQQIIEADSDVQLASTRIRVVRRDTSLPPPRGQTSSGGLPSGSSSLPPPRRPSERVPVRLPRQECDWHDYHCNHDH